MMIFGIALMILVVFYALYYLHNHLSSNSNSTEAINAVNATLPQLQCAQCGYPGCTPYASAIIKDKAPINLCPPGGSDVVNKLVELLNQTPTSVESFEQTLAQINENECIGCVQCIKVCPVDAIIGAKKYSHTVIDELCTGCGLCEPVCPTNCITMVSDE